ncbi:hypothetical protein BST61_g7794 [Cercospora zeina]
MVWKHHPQLAPPSTASLGSCCSCYELIERLDGRRSPVHLGRPDQLPYVHTSGSSFDVVDLPAPVAQKFIGAGLG